VSRSGGPRRAARYYRQLPAPVRLLSAGVLVNNVGGFVTMFLTLILATRGISAAEIAVALIVSSAFAVAGAWLGGALLSRMPARRVIIGSMAGSALFTAALIPAGPYPVTVAVVCLIAVCNRAYVPAATTLVGSSSPPDQRMQMFSFFQLFNNIGAAVAPAIAGFLLTRSLTVLLVIDAATSAAFALVAARLPGDAVPAGPRPAGGCRTRDTTGRRRRYLLFCAGAALVAVAYAQRSGALPLAFHDRRDSLELLGYLFTGSTIAVVIFQFPVSFLASRIDIRLTLALGAALIGGGYCLLLAGFSVPALVASTALWTAGELVYAPAAPTVATMMSSSRTHGAYQGTLYSARTAGQALGPAFGVLAYSAGASAAWWGCGALGVVAACLFLITVRPRDAGGPDGDRAPATAAAGG
jgi:MFS family permease